MARRPRRYRAPLVITLAATLGPACGGPPDYVPNTPGDGDGDGDQATGGYLPSVGSGGEPTASGGTLASGGQSSGGQSSGGNPPKPEVPSCPTDPYLELLGCAPGELCAREMDCTSGEKRDFLFTCDESGEGWHFLEGFTCPKPWEYCDGSGDAAVCDGVLWVYQGAGGNPPAPCPDEAPELGEACSAGYGFGADRTACGYPCGEDDWTVLGCVTSDEQNPYGTGIWEGDGQCSAEAGGAGGASN